MKYSSLLLIFFLFGMSARASDEKPATDIFFWLGNESNPVDGVFGPLTYGLSGSHRFAEGYELQATYINLHEPNTTLLAAVTDEAQIKFLLPENSEFQLGFTLWKNRMINMYTDVAGVEITTKNNLTLNLGLYGGTASLDVDSGDFRGIQLGLSGTFGPVDIAVSTLSGKIGSRGYYRKNALEASSELPPLLQLPLTISFAIEQRYFDFGGSGPRNDANDEFIYVTGLELHF